MKTVKILVTGFEPFGGEKVNPSYEAVKMLPDKIKEATLIKKELPVTFKGAAKLLREMIEELKPDVVICTGQAGGRAVITIEKVAINFRKTGSIPDANGYVTEGEAIDEDGPTAYFSSLPVEELKRTMCEAGVPGQVSYTAGTYVCNEVMYELLNCIEMKKPETQMIGGFIHVPYSPEQVADKAAGTASMSIELMSKGLEKAVECIIDEINH